MQYMHSVTGVYRDDKPDRDVISAVEERIKADQERLQKRQRERLSALRREEAENESEANEKAGMQNTVNRRIDQ